VLADTYTETSSSTGVREDVRGSVAGGGDIVRVEVGAARAAIDVPAGSYYVPLNQPLANRPLRRWSPTRKTATSPTGSSTSWETPHA